MSFQYRCEGWLESQLFYSTQVYLTYLKYDLRFSVISFPCAEILKKVKNEISQADFIITAPRWIVICTYRFDIDLFFERMTYEEKILKLN